MSIPGFNRPAALRCSRCLGAGLIEARTAELGKGWRVVSITCPNCRGKGTLRRR